jgi:hypothetical protein
MRVLTCVLVVLLLMSARPASAQTTRPAPDQAWPQTMASFGKALLGGDIAAMEKVLTPRATIRRFEATHDEESWRLFEHVGKSTLVGQHAYMHPPMVMAADVSADFKNAAAVPDKAKVKFMIDDETEMKRANATAAQWMGEIVEAKHGAPVGVLVLWTPRPTASGAAPVSEAAPAYDIVFILCRGEQVGTNKFRIASVVYGSPVQQQDQ